MKNIFYLLFTCMAALFMLSSCSTIEEVVSRPETKSRSIDYYEREITKEAVYQKPLVADLDVAKQKLSFGRTYENISTKEAQDYVTAEFSIGQNCDVIVHPMYETVTTNTGGVVKVDVTITGYPAFYRNIRTFEVKDTDSWMIYSYYNPSQEETKKSGKSETEIGGAAAKLLQMFN